MLLPCPTTMEAVIPFCWRAGSLFILGASVLFKARCRFWGSWGSSGLSPSYRTGHASSLPNKWALSLNPVFLWAELVGHLHGCFWERTWCVFENWKHRSHWTQIKYKPYNNEPLSECRSPGSHSGILASLFSVALLSCWVWGKETEFTLLAFSIRHPGQEPKAEIQKTALCLSVSIGLCPDTSRIHKQTGTGNWIMTGSHEIVLSFPISTQGNLHSAVPYSHTTRLPLSGFPILSLVEGNYSKCAIGKRITVCSCSLFNNPMQHAIIL